MNWTRMLRWNPLPLMMLQLSGPMNSCSGNSSAEDEFALIQCIPQSSLLGKNIQWHTGFWHLLATWRSQSAHVNDDARYMHSSMQVEYLDLQHGGRNLLTLMTTRLFISWRAKEGRHCAIHGQRRAAIDQVSMMGGCSYHTLRFEVCSQNRGQWQCHKQRTSYMSWQWESVRNEESLSALQDVQVSMWPCLLFRVEEEKNS